MRTYHRPLTARPRRTTQSFVLLATPRETAALRIFHLSSRLLADNPQLQDRAQKDSIIEPLVAVEDSGAWDGLAPWLERVLAKCTPAPTHCFLATASVAKPVHAAAAPRLLSLILSEAQKDYYKSVRDYLSQFVCLHVGSLPRSWLSLCEAPGFACLVPPAAVCDAFVAAPSADMLLLVCRMLEHAPQDVATLGHIAARVSAAVRGGRCASDPALTVAVACFAAAVGRTLPPPAAASLLAAHGLVPAVCLPPPPLPLPAPAAQQQPRVLRSAAAGGGVASGGGGSGGGGGRGVAGAARLSYNPKDVISIDCD